PPPHPPAQPREAVASAIIAVRDIGVAQAGPRLGMLASDPPPDGNLRMEAVTPLGALRALDQLPIVQDLITDDWPALRAAAIRAAVAIDPDNFTLILSGLEGDRHWMGRAALADALGMLPPAVSLIRLNDLVNDEEQRVIPHARPPLGMLPPAVSLIRLNDLVNDEDQRVIPHALRALVRLKAPDVDQVLLARLKDQDYAIR